MRVEWRPIAEADLLEIIGYIAFDSPAAAERIFAEITTRTLKLARHPRMGRKGRVAGTREFVVSGTPYIAVYQITGNAVVIIRVIHGARAWPVSF